MSKGTLDYLLNRHFNGFMPLRKIGEGGMGAVFALLRDIYAGNESLYREFFSLKSDERLEHYVKQMARMGMDSADLSEMLYAGKALSKNSNIDRFKREEKVLRKLKHDNIVKIFETGSIGSVPFYVMEYVDSIDLKRAKFSVEDSIKIISGALDGLLHAHARSIYHRDIKPENILVNSDLSVIRLTDFGLAKPVRYLDEEEMTKTSPGMMGTPVYWDPERATQQDLSTDEEWAKVDMYCLGATFYTLLTGDLPVDMKSKKNLFQLVRSIKDEDPPKIHDDSCDIPADLRHILGIWMAKNPDHRATPREARYMLDEYMKGNQLDNTTTSRELKRETKKLAKNGESLKEAAEKSYLRGCLESLDSRVIAERKRAFLDSYRFYDEYLRLKELDLTPDEIEDVRLRSAVSKKHAAFENRRMELAGIEEPPESMAKRAGKKAGLAALALAALSGLGLVGSNIYSDFRLNSEVEEYAARISGAIESEDFGAASSLHREVSELIADEPRSSEAFQSVSALGDRIDSLEVRLSDRSLSSRISDAFEQARRLLDDDQYDSARDSLETALGLVDDLSDGHGYGSLVSSVRSFSAVIDDQQSFDSAAALYDSALSDLDVDAVESAIDLSSGISDEALRTDVEERRYQLAESLFEKFSVYMQEREFSSASSTVEVLEAVIDGFEHEGLAALRTSFVEQKNVLRQYETHIRIYNGLMEQVDAELELIEQYESQLSDGELFGKVSIDQLSARLSNILMMLNDPVAMNPEAIGRRLDSSVQHINGLITERIPELQEHYNSVAVDHYSSILDELESGIVRDYTRDIDYSVLLQRLSGLDLPDALSDRASSLNEELSSLQSSREDFLGWQQSGSDEDKLSLMRSYLLFGHLDEAAGLARSLDVQEYMVLISLHRSVFDEANFVRRTEDGLTESMVADLQDYISVYRQTGSCSNLVDVLSMVERAGLDIGDVDDDLIAGEATVDELISVYQAARSAVENGYRGPDPYSVRRLAEAYRGLGLDEAIENFEED